MKKAVGFMAASAVLLTLTGCLGLKQISTGISDDGMVQAHNVVFPDPSKAWKKHGRLVGDQQLSKIKAGISKDELYQLIGSPHFSESNNAREWDYILKSQVGDTADICQFKVIFDKAYKGQQFYDKPANCAKSFGYRKTVINHIAPVATPAKLQDEQIANRPLPPETIYLIFNSLFEFDEFMIDDTSSIQQAFDEIAHDVRAYQQANRSVRIVITGHSDQIGNKQYNLNLSLLRAKAVKSYLVSRGIDEGIVEVAGLGSSNPVTTCDKKLPRADLIDCLEPNRRVEIMISVK